MKDEYVSGDGFKSSRGVYLRNSAGNFVETCSNIKYKSCQIIDIQIGVYDKTRAWGYLCYNV